jgi:hypothetical protein
LKTEFCAFLLNRFVLDGGMSTKDWIAPKFRLISRDYLGLYLISVYTQD